MRQWTKCFTVSFVTFARKEAPTLGVELSKVEVRRQMNTEEAEAAGMEGALLKHPLLGDRQKLPQNGVQETSLETIERLKKLGNVARQSEQLEDHISNRSLRHWKILYLVKEFKIMWRIHWSSVFNHWLVQFVQIIGMSC